MEDVLSVIAVIIAPIIAVWVGQRLQERAQKRQDKMQLFKTLMAGRAYNWTYEAVVALNIIEIVFADDEDVVNKWRDYYDKLYVDKATDAELKKIQDAKNKLLETMAHSLGYKKQIRWDIIENPYIPKGMIEEMSNRQHMQNSQLEALDRFINMFVANEKRDTYKSKVAEEDSNK